MQKWFRGRTPRRALTDLGLDPQDLAQADHRALYRAGYHASWAIVICSFTFSLTWLLLRQFADEWPTTIAVIGDFSADPQAGSSRNIGMAWDIRRGVTFAHSEAIDKSDADRRSSNDRSLPTDRFSTDTGLQLGLKFIDDRGNTRTARAAALASLFDPSVVAVIGHSRSSTSHAAMRYYEDASFAVLLPIASTTSINLSQAGSESRPVFRMPPNNNVQAASIIDAIENRQLKANLPLAILFIDDAYGRSLGHAVYDGIRATTSAFPPIPMKEGDAVITQVLELRPRISGLVLCCYHRQAALVVAAARLALPEVPVEKQTSASRDDPIPIFLSDGCVDEELFELVPIDIWRNCLFFFPPSLTFERADAFWGRFDQWAEDRPPYLSGQRDQARKPGFTAYGFDSFYIMARALRRSEEPTSMPLINRFIPGRWNSRQRFSNALVSLLTTGQGVTDALTGTYLFKETGGERTEDRYWRYRVSTSEGTVQFLRVEPTQ